MSTMTRMNNTERARFDSYLSYQGECTLWTGGMDRDGYGRFFFRKKSRRAHRVAYWNEVGDIPAGMVVDHTCRNRACVEPRHLRLLTARENALTNSSSVAALNRLKTACPEGHPYDRQYGGQRYCSTCDAAKARRLRSKWKAEGDTVRC